MECDTHADTCVLGADALIIQNYNRPVNVTGYDTALGSRTYQTVSGVRKYRHPHTGLEYALVIHQAIHIPHLDHDLFCLMQSRVNDVTINDIPTFLCTNPTPEDHAIIVTDPLTPNKRLIMPMFIRGVTSYLPTEVMTYDDWVSGDYPVIDLTSEHLEWDPTNPRYEDQENSMLDRPGEIIRNTTSRGPLMVINSVATTTVDAADITDDDNLGDVLESYVNCTSSDCTVSDLKSTTDPRAVSETES